MSGTEDIPLDDGLGTSGIIVACANDCNSLIHHEDVFLFLECFKQLAEPLGAVLNITKKRIIITATATVANL
jgi:hypothetical protein